MFYYCVDEVVRSSSIDGFETIVDRDEGLFGWSGGSDVFFAPGRAELTREGQTRLDALVAELNKTEYPIRVIGHTDTDPVNKTKDLWPEGNIQLGAGRAISVRKYLSEKGIDMDRMSIMSYGEYKPMEDGKSAEAKRKNRRVDVMVEVFRGENG